jgi:hypothetical protein
LAGLLAAYVIDDPQAPANFSVLFGEAGEGRPALHRLYRGHRDIGRSRQADVLIHSLIAHLDDLTIDTANPQLTGIGLVRGAGVVLAPGIGAEAASLAGSRLARAGIKITDAPRLQLRLPSKIVVPTIDLDLVDRAVIEGATDANGPIACPGEYRLRGLILPRYDGPSPPTQPSALVRMLGAMTFPPDDVEEVLDLLIDLTAGVPVIAGEPDTRRIDGQFISTVSSLLEDS